MPGLDEDVLEAAFWNFDAEYKRTGALHDAFKHQMRSVIRAHLAAYVQTLTDAEDYVRAYKCQCNAIEGIPGASRCLRRITDLLRVYQEER